MGSNNREDGEDEAIPLTSYSHNAMLDLNPTTTPWKPGFWRRLPRAGIFASFVAFAATISMYVIVKDSDGQPISSWKWKFRPTVLLSISYTISNIALRFALGQVVKLAWWAKALEHDTKVRDLHNIWSFGDSLWEIAGSIRGFNYVALGSLLVSLVPVNGPILQKASAVEEQVFVEKINITIPIAQNFPARFTGLVFSEKSGLSALGPKFGNVLRDYNNRIPYWILDSGCKGRCKGKLLGAGYEMRCTNSTEVTKPEKYDTGNVSSFFTAFTYKEEQGGNINYSSAVRSECHEWGALSWDNCTMRPATIEYPILMINDTIELDPEFSVKTDRIMSYRNVIPRGPGNNGSTHGGMYLALKSRFDSWAGLQFFPSEQSNKSEGANASEDRAIYTSEGVSALEFHTHGADCEDSWNYATVEMLSAARELSFRSALYAAFFEVDYVDDTVNVSSLQEISGESYDTLPVRDPSEYLQTIEVEQTTTRAIYRSDYIWLWIAIGITFLTNVCVVSMFAGCRSLGRKVSLSPIEIARAFGAPLLSKATDPNATVELLLKQAGGMKIAYGAVWTHGSDTSNSQATLKFEEADRCEKPHYGQEFES